MTLPFTFDIFSPFSSVTMRVQVHRAERHLLHEVQARHHHAGHPEEEDVVAGDQHVVG